MRKLITIISISILAMSCSNVDDPIDENSTLERTTFSVPSTQNLVVITLDGLRWQEVYGEEDVLDKNYLSQYGSLFGDRNYGNKVNVANPSRLSHPGYHEIFTGNTTAITSNNPNIYSPHKSVFEYINEQPGYGGINVQAFGIAWFVRSVFRMEESTFPIYTPGMLDVNDAVYDFDDLIDTDFTDPDIIEQYDPEGNMAEIEEEIADLKPQIEQYGGDNILDYNEEAELLLYAMGKQSMKRTHPKVTYFQFGMTDNYAHQNDFNTYLKAGRNVSVFIKDLIDYIEQDNFYANNTTILITTDHGRGSETWQNHGGGVEGSDESWFMLLSPNVENGIVNTPEQYYSEQLAQTMAKMIGLNYTAEHEIAEPVNISN